MSSHAFASAGPGPLDRSVVFALLKRSRAVLQLWGRATREPDFKPQIYASLAIIAASPGISQSELAERTRSDQAQLSVVLSALELRGLIARRRSPFDERIRGIFLLPLDTERFATLRSEFRAFEERVARNLSESEQRLLIELLDKLAA